MDLADPTTSRTKMTLASALPTVETVEGLAEKFAGEAGFDEDTVSHIAMVAREATVNAVMHGNKYDPGKQVTVSLETTSEALTIKIADQGAGLNPETIPDPLAPENIMRSSGRGVFLMRAFMDEVRFRQLDPGTEITLVKNRVTKETEQ